MHSTTSSLMLLTQRRRSSAPAARTLEPDAYLRQHARDQLRHSEARAPVVLSTMVMRELVR